MVTAVVPRTYRTELRATSHPRREPIAPSVILSLIIEQRRSPTLRPFVIHLDGPGSVFDEPVTWEDAEWQ